MTQDQQGDTATSHDAAPAEQPKQVGRYRIEQVLGKGGFGLVYLAQDEQLKRQVAIKVPHAHLISKPEYAETYLAEARTVANLDHPGIVPVYDVGSTAEFPFYIVSKFVEGSDLSSKLKQQRLKYNEAAELVALIAQALHFAHKQGLVHRDVKPSNILIAKDGQPFVVDFGLALREENVGKGPKYAGTPAYMSPEQARGEGHRVDGRSDIFSLGVVFYEMLVGRKPFRGETLAELFEQVTSYEAKPLRQYDDNIPKELERICHKAMAKRASERYSTAKDFGDDLRHFLVEPTVIQNSASPGGITSEASVEHVSSRASYSVAASSALMNLGSANSQPVKIVPKGLRSFESHDADFFLELLPGPRDRDGLPDSLRFWKARIEETDPDTTFSVGLIYGPSGCGKSSLVKAGLLPRLSDDVISVYIEATPNETETRLLHGLRKRCPALEDNLSLKDTVAALRRGQGIPVGKKVLIVIDQFEQWLHAKKQEESSDLVQALRQCEGGRVQCIVMVRDDFWMAATRFMRGLEVRLIEGHNSAAVDLFPAHHAGKVLVAFGRAFGTLPDQISEISKQQNDFIKQSVTGLAEEGKVICVRLALFAEMMKSKAWTPASLKEVGGTQGVGVAFLEETFSVSTSPPEHRYHQNAARAVLKDLLPNSDTGIKGHMRSHGDLMKVSGYEGRPKDFDELIRILDSEIRLITRTDPEGKNTDDDAVRQTQPDQKYFQLTHDYLVHPLRDWLTRKQKENRNGRAELKLCDTATTWNSKPENRFLPSWWESLNISLLTDRRKWTEPQRKMMRKAGQVHGLRSALVLAAAAAIVFGGVTIRYNIEKNRQELVAQKQAEQNDAEAKRLVEGLLQAETSQVKIIIGNLAGYRQSAMDDLSKAFAESPDDSNAKLHAALAMLPDDSVLAFLKERLLTVTPAQFSPVCDLLKEHKSDLISDYWEIVNDNNQAAPRRFQAACALASYDSNNEHWRNEKYTQFLAKYLVDVLPWELLPWRNSLRPVKAHLIAPLAAIYRDPNEGEQIRNLAADALAEYLSDDAEALYSLLIDANQQQFGPIFEKLAVHQKRAVELGIAEVAKKPVQDASEDEKEALAMQQANAAVMLFRMDAVEQVWPLLKHSSDPRVRSYIIHWLGTRGGKPQAIVARYEQERDVTIKRALLLCLGEFKLADTERQPLLETLLKVYGSDPDAGLHSAAEWLLRKWQQAEKIDAINQDLQQKEEQLTVFKEKDRAWYINGEGQTFVILDAGEFQMGSPASEAGRSTIENLHRQNIGRRIAISTKEVTIEQWRFFSQANPGKVWAADRENVDQLKPADIPPDDSPMLAMRWSEAAWYCNWLSEREGVPREQWCYEPNDQGQYGPGMKAKENFLDLVGYRLPTEAEWEFACRAGARTSRYYGETEILLAKYAWYLNIGDDHSWPVASLKPNDFGLFDMLGNASEWCYDAYFWKLTDSETDASATEAVEATGVRVLRGGSYNIHAWYARSANRIFIQPEVRLFNFGFRPVRTYHLFF